MENTDRYRVTLINLKCDHQYSCLTANWRAGYWITIILLTIFLLVHEWKSLYAKKKEYLNPSSTDKPYHVDNVNTGAVSASKRRT